MDYFYSYHQMHTPKTQRGSIHIHGPLILTTVRSNQYLTQFLSTLRIRCPPSCHFDSHNNT